MGRTALVSWIGHADLAAMAESWSESRRERLRQQVKFLPKPDGSGPIRTLVEAVRFDEVHLIFDHPLAVGREFARWLKGAPELHPVSLRNPTDYEEVFRVVDGALQQILGIKGVKRRAPPELSFHLSPGTPAMAATWVLLGKSRYPATLYQTYRGEVSEASIPFDLEVDVLPHLLREPDRQLQHLVARPPGEVEGFEQILGDSAGIRIAVERARRAALRHVPVLLKGESGTGKEMFAHAIHNASPRRAGPFVPINCAAIPATLLESELFGHKRGAFTGADRDRVGAFEEADGGTLFLDEVGECDEAMQAKLLRVLQPPAGKGPCHRQFRRLGESHDRAADVRVVAATNKDLAQAVREHAFREDLYYRLAVITVLLPPLRERQKDVHLIAAELLSRINAEFREQEPGYIEKRLTPGARTYLKRHRWPGNVRELYNALLQCAVMVEGENIDRRDLAEAAGSAAQNPAESPLERPFAQGFRIDAYLDDLHRRLIQKALEESGNKKAGAARLLGMKNYQTLDARMTRLKV